MPRNTVGRLATLAIITGALFVVPAGAQRRADMDHDMPRYDTATEATFTGDVRQVLTESDWAERTRTRNPMLRGHRASRLERLRMMGTHLMLRTEQGRIEVHVAPASFLAQNGFEIAEDDRIEVVGSRVTFGDRDAVVARQIKKGEQVLALRDADGMPLWSAHRTTS